MNFTYGMLKYRNIQKGIRWDASWHDAMLRCDSVMPWCCDVMMLERREAVSSRRLCENRVLDVEKSDITQMAGQSLQQLRL